MEVYLPNMPITSGTRPPEPRGPGRIYERMVEVMRKVDPIGKNRRNQQGSGYNFRGIDDLYNELHDTLAKVGVFTMPTVLDERSEERLTKSGGTLIYRIIKVRYRFFADDGSYVDSEVVGEGMDSGDKASNKAMSAAHKYCLLQAFFIATEDSKEVRNEDSEKESHEVEPRPKAEPVKTEEVFSKLNPAHTRRATELARKAGVQNDDDFKAIFARIDGTEAKAVAASIKRVWDAIQHERSMQ